MSRLRAGSASGVFIAIIAGATATHCNRREAVVTETAAVTRAIVATDTRTAGAVVVTDVVAVDAPARTDATDVSPRRPLGYIRFVHIAAGSGPVRFIAVNVEQYEHSYVEATVDEGSTSGYLPLASVPHMVRVRSAGAADDAGADLTAPLSADVYNGLGCTVVLVGRAVAPRRDAGLEARHLTRVVDLPRRGDAGTAILRFMPAVNGAPTFDLHEGEQTLYAGLTMLDITGLRIVAAGEHRFTLNRPDAGGAIGAPVNATVPPDEAHTLWFWGSAPVLTRAGAAIDGGGVRALLTRDIPGG